MTNVRRGRHAKEWRKARADERTAELAALRGSAVHHIFEKVAKAVSKNKKGGNRAGRRNTVGRQSAVQGSAGPAS